MKRGQGFAFFFECLVDNPNHARLPLKRAEPEDGSALLEKMLLKDGAELEASFGVRPFHEDDLIMRVGRKASQEGRSALSGNNHQPDTRQTRKNHPRHLDRAGPAGSRGGFGEVQMT